MYGNNIISLKGLFGIHLKRRNPVADILLGLVAELGPVQIRAASRKIIFGALGVSILSAY